MPFKMTLERDVLLLVFSGVITSEDLRKLIEDVLHQERDLTVIPPRLADLRAVTSMNISFPDILSIAQVRKQQTFKNNFRSALLVNSPVQMGYARMFQNLNDHPQISLKVFTEEADARAWLAEKKCLV